MRPPRPAVVGSTTGQKTHINPIRRRERAMAGFKSGRAEGTCDWTRNSLVEVDGQLDEGDRIPPSGGLRRVDLLGRAYGCLSDKFGGDRFARDCPHSQPPRRGSLFIAWRGQPTENRACFAVNRNSQLLNAGAFPAITGLRGVRSPRARCKGEFGGNREFLRFRPQNRENIAGFPTNKPRASRNINALQTFPVFFGTGKRIVDNRETNGGNRETNRGNRE